MSKEEEFVGLIQSHQGLIYKITTIYTRDREEREDLYQEIVYQTWKSFDYFKKASKPSTWLYRVGMNTAITHLNKRKKYTDNVVILDQRMDFAEDLDYCEEEKMEQLYAEIRKLNLLDRGIIFLFLEGNSHDEIAEVTGISVSNVGTRMSRIREKLKKGVKTV